MFEIYIIEILIKDRFGRDYGDIKQLLESIKKIGLLHPVVIDSEKRLICGERSLKAFEYLGIERIPARIIDILL